MSISWLCFTAAGFEFIAAAICAQSGRTGIQNPGLWFGLCGIAIALAALASMVRGGAS